MNLFEKQSNEFASRHIGPDEHETRDMLKTIGMETLDELIDQTIPASIRNKNAFDITAPAGEFEYLTNLRELASKNKIFRNYIGQGYYDTITPSVILRNVFENPGWYTQYTPYQAEISQGRLESLLNYQTLVADLTGLPLANASLLDEGTAAAEAMTMFFNQKNKDHDHITVPKFFVDNAVFPQTRDILVTRAAPIGIQLEFGHYRDFEKLDADLLKDYFGAIVQYPASDGLIRDYRAFINTLHEAGAYVAMATDLMALTVLESPGELGADVAIGSAQRFGVPVGFGGPHAAFFATRDDFKRAIPGRIIGVSIDAQGNRALRMALQTREQHIKREKATSNICTAQALLANMASLYAVYHGPQGLVNIAKRISLLALSLSDELSAIGFKNNNEYYFDTLHVVVDDSLKIKAIAESYSINFSYPEAGHIIISLDETTTREDVLDIVSVFAASKGVDQSGVTFDEDRILENIPAGLKRTSSFLTHPVF